MKSRYASLLSVVAAFGIATVSSASAQYYLPPIQQQFWETPRMPMGDPIRRQLELNQEGDLAARQAFDLCIKLSAQARAMGQDPGTCGATQGSLRASGSRLNQQYEINRGSAEINGKIRQQAIDSYVQRALRNGVPGR